MRAAIRRELIVVARCEPLGAALVAHNALLTLFLLLWGDAGGVPAPSWPALYEQLRAMELLSLALVIPWAVARCVAAERADELVILASVAGVPPSRLVGAKLVAAVVVSTLAVMSAAPLSVLARQISGTAWLRVAADSGTLIAFGMAAAAIARACAHGMRCRVSGWLAAVLGTLSVVGLVHRGVPDLPQALTYAAIAAVVILASMVRSTTSVAYLSEHQR